MKLFRWFRRILVLLSILCLCASIALGGLGWKMYREALETKSLTSMVEEIREKPGYTSLDELPNIYLDAVIAVEDQRFYSHSGVDFIAIGRAIWNDLKKRELVEGGSTITQQLAKNLYFTQEKKIVRKAAELFMAFELERLYSKDEILELYLNSIYFGNGYYCIGDACQGYFGKEPGEMTSAESTLLAGIPNAPSVYALSNCPELAQARQRQVLNQMVKQNYLTESEVEQILEQSVNRIAELQDKR